MKKTFTPSSLILKVRIAALASMVFVLAATSLAAQCVVVGTGTVTGNVNFGSSNNWANPNRSTLSDDLYARTQLQAGEVSKYLMVSDYGWVIPPGATIDGIEVRIEGHQEDLTANFADASIVLSKLGVPASADLAGTGFYDDKDFVNTYGGPTDLWGTSWTPADIMDPGFGVLYSVTRTGGTGSLYMFVDYVELTVYFSGNGCTLPVTYRSYNVTLEANKTVKLDWVTATEVNTDRFNVQRSTDGRNFESVGAVLAQGNSASDVTYTFVDEQRLSGTAFYRLEQVDMDGDVAYSEIKAVSSDFGTLSITTFPNPATEVLHIQGAVSGANVGIYDIKGTLVQQVTLDSDLATLDIAGLTPGMYIVQVRTTHGAASQKIIVQ